MTSNLFKRVKKRGACDLQFPPHLKWGREGPEQAGTRQFQVSESKGNQINNQRTVLLTATCYLERGQKEPEGRCVHPASHVSAPRSA